MNEVITSAGQLLKEVRAFQGVLLQTSGPAYGAVEKYFSCENRIPWQVGTVRFERLVDRAMRDLDILPVDRRGRYEETLANKVKILVRPGVYGGVAKDLAKANITELTLERLENFHDGLVLAGRSMSFESDRIDLVIGSISDLIAEMAADPCEIDDAIKDKLTELMLALERYSLFGSEGVKDYVASLIGATITRGMEVGGPLPSSVKTRINKVLGVSKAAMDGFVYLTSGMQGVEWAGAHLGLLGAN